MPGGQVVFKDPDTGVSYGLCSAEMFAGFSFPLRLEGKFGISVSQGKVGECGVAEPGVPTIGASIGFAMNGWNMKAFGFKYLHVGNVGFDMALTATPPYFDSFAGQAAFCTGTTGRCAVCELVPW